MLRHRYSVLFYIKILAGFLCGLALLLVSGEIYARYNPPADLRLYLGDRSPLSGHFKQDSLLGVDYVDFAAFERDYHERLKVLGPLSSPRVTYAWFGNSFVQATGMLGDTAQNAFPEDRMLFLQRNEILPLRIAQLRLLLEQGLRPRRIFFVLLPIDLQGWDKKPLASYFVNKAGALTFKIASAPNVLSQAIESSDLMRLAWIRVGGHAYESMVGQNAVKDRLTSSATEDITSMFLRITDLSKAYNSPVTIVILPNREQIFGKQGFELQDSLVRIAISTSLDVFDARSVFSGIADPKGLFLPDWHFNAEGNRMVFHALLEHLQAIGAPMAPGPSP